MIQQQNTITSGRKISIVQHSSLPFRTEGPFKGSLNTDIFIRAPATDMCHRYLVIPDSGLTQGLSFLQTVTSMKRRVAAGKSEARSADFLNEIFSPWILETEMSVAQWHSGILKRWLVHQGKLDALFYYSLTYTKKTKSIIRFHSYLH